MNFTRYFTEARWTQQVCYIIIHESHLSQHRVIRRTGKSLPMRRLTIATWPSLIAKPGPKVIMFFIPTSVIIEDETRIKFSHIFSSITPTIYAQYKVVILRLYIYIYSSKPIGNCLRGISEIDVERLVGTRILDVYPSDESDLPLDGCSLERDILRNRKFHLFPIAAAFIFARP